MSRRNRERRQERKQMVVNVSFESLPPHLRQAVLNGEPVSISEADLPQDILPWTPFEEIKPEEMSSKLDTLLGRDGRIRYYEHTAIFSNSKYTVFVRKVEESCGLMYQLGIKRNDRGHTLDWRELQRIKNELLGPEFEGVMLFPAESRLVDTSNHFWLYCTTQASERFPFGFVERRVGNPDAASDVGARQRPFEPGQEPVDVMRSGQAAHLVAEHFRRLQSLPASGGS